LFTEDDAASTTPPVIISHRFWTSSFGAAPDVIGREIELDETRHRIVGVMSARMRFPEANASVWRPMLMTPTTPSPQRIMAIVVRHGGVPAEQLTARLRDVSRSLVQAKLLPEGHFVYGDVLVQERFGRSNQQPYWLMFGAVMLVVLVACVNVSNLLLARASSNHAQLALRSALGAGRARLIAAAVLECFMIAVAAGVAGIVLARWLLQVLLAILPPQLTLLAANSSTLDTRVLSFAIAIALLSCLLAVMLPVLRILRVDPLDALKQHAHNISGRDDFFQGALIAGQLALVLILLAGGGLLLRSFIRLANVDTGIDTRNLVIVQAALTSRQYISAGAAKQLLATVEEHLESSGVMRVTHSGNTPVVGPAIYMNVTPEAEGGVAIDFTGQILPLIEAAPDYFETLGIPMLAGRTFNASDPDEVVIVNDRLARAYWGNEPAVGKRFRASREQPWRTVIGVVGDVRQMQLSDPSAHGMEMYVREGRARAGGFYSILARTTASPAATIATIKQTIWAADPRIPLTDAMTLDDRLAESMYYQRFFLRLSMAFTIIATTLAVIGVYGAFAYWVARRKRELAIRIAIGASPEHLISSVLGRALRLAAAGAAIGLAIALAGAQLIETMLFEIDPRDPITLVAVTALLAIAAVVACAVPAIRAARVDPMTTLRAE
jgi:putative ABC transport system permease protein